MKKIFLMITVLGLTSTGFAKMQRFVIDWSNTTDDLRAHIEANCDTSPVDINYHAGVFAKPIIRKNFTPQQLTLIETFSSGNQTYDDSDSYAGEVYLVKEKQEENYPHGVYYLAKVTKTKNAVTLSMTLLNYTGSAELSEGMLCGELSYKLAQ